MNITPLNDRTAQMLAELAGTPTVAQRVRSLQAQAKNLAKDHINAMVSATRFANDLALEIAEGGEAYPAGVRDLARRLVEDNEARIQTIEAIAART